SSMTSLSTGLVTYPSQPAASAFCSSPAIAWAVSATIGISCVLGSSLRWCVSVNPSTSGSWRSRRIRCGRSHLSVTSVSMALALVCTSYPALDSRTRISLRLVALSSTTRMDSPRMRRQRDERAELVKKRLGASRFRHDALYGRRERGVIRCREVLRRPDDHGNALIRGLAAKPLEELESIDIRHEEIENDHAGALLGGGREACLSVRRAADVIAVRLEEGGDERDRSWVVVDHEDEAGRDARAAQCVEQGVAARGFLEDVGDMTSDAEAVVRGHRDDDHGCRGVQAIAADGTQERVSAHVREQEVEEDRRVPLLTTSLERHRPGRCLFDVVAVSDERLAAERPIGCLVLDDEDHGVDRWGGRRSGGEGQNRGEDGAARVRAPEGDAASLGFHDSLGERQAEARALILLCRAGIELLELDEETALVVEVDADARILDLQSERVRSLGASADRNQAAVGRELDGIREIIVEHLLELHRVADDG